MSTVHDLLEKVKAWYQQFELDVVAGRLDKLADEALSDLRPGRRAAFAENNRRISPFS